jgi:hypothetical protein
LAPVRCSGAAGFGGGFGLLILGCVLVGLDRIYQAVRTSSAAEIKALQAGFRNAGETVRAGAGGIIDRRAVVAADASHSGAADRQVPGLWQVSSAGRQRMPTLWQHQAGRTVLACIHKRELLGACRRLRLAKHPGITPPLRSIAARLP